MGVENMELKQKLFAEYDKIAPAKTILASNTSSLPISEIASSSSRPDRFGGLHFFNPVPVMKLLEVVRIPETSDETFNAMADLVVEAVVENMERGDASAKDVDLAMKLGAGHPMGPFQLADYVGLDTTKFIMDGWSERFPDESLFRKSELLNSLVAEGKLGMKTKEGFFKY